MKVVKDPVSGQLPAPTSQHRAAPKAAQPRPCAPAPRGLLTGKVNPQPVTLADGTVMQELDDSTLVKAAPASASAAGGAACAKPAAPAHKPVK